MARRERKCICCSTEYFYCPDCNGADRLKPAWYAEFCSEDCKDLWLTATKFNMGMVEKKEAKETILALNLKDKSEYVGCVQRDLDVILEEEPIIVNIDAEIKEIAEDKAIVETSIRGSNKKHTHEVIIKKENE